MPKKMLTLEDLTEKQANFVRLFVETGGAKGMLTQIVYQAGYECSSDVSARNIASKNLRDPRVLEVIRGLTDAKFRAGAVVAADFLMDVINGNVDGQVPKVSERIKAAQDLLDRAGLMVINRSEVDVNVTDGRSIAELEASVNARLANLGLPALQVTDQRPEKETIDAEFTEVDPAAPYGRSCDDKPGRGPGVGRPRKKPGRKPWKRRLITNPEAIPDYYETRAEKENKERRERMIEKARRLAERNLVKKFEKAMMEERTDGE